MRGDACRIGRFERLSGGFLPFLIGNWARRKPAGFGVMEAKSAEICGVAGVGAKD